MIRPVSVTRTGNVATPLPSDSAAPVPRSNFRPWFEEMRRASAGGVADYSGITYERITAENGVFWPSPGGDHPGTPCLFLDTFPIEDGRARFGSLPVLPDHRPVD